MDELLASYTLKKDAIRERLKEFKSVINKSEEDVFAELVFCILTPQSKARMCGKAVNKLVKNNSIRKSHKEIAKHLRGIVRFHNTKARHIINARDFFLSNGIKDKLAGNPTEVREWLVKNVYGLGYKEASHFLRNIGLGENLAILDRHIMKNLVRYKVIRAIPKSLTRKRYMEIEEEMKRFSKTLGIPVAHLDLLFWSRETGEIFK